MFRVVSFMILRYRKSQVLDSKHRQNKEKGEIGECGNQTTPLADSIDDLSVIARLSGIVCNMRTHMLPKLSAALILCANQHQFILLEYNRTNVR